MLSKFYLFIIIIFPTYSFKMQHFGVILVVYVKPEDKVCIFSQALATFSLFIINRDSTQVVGNNFSKLWHKTFVSLVTKYLWRIEEERGLCAIARIKWSFRKLLRFPDTSLQSQQNGDKIKLLAFFPTKSLKWKRPIF